VPEQSSLLPRPVRRRHRAKADRGLPSDKELTRLAEDYLKFQRSHWPQFVEAGFLPAAESAVISTMVEDFKLRHRGGRVDPRPLQALLKLCPRFAGNYNRYSCDNSKPTSIVDQMIRCLDKALKEQRFVPWAYVYADYSITGLTSSRLGYSAYKRLLSEKEQQIETTYVDDFTRASREELEWWKLASLSKRVGKRMIGASDGFDLSAQDWDIKITIYGLLSRLFIKSTREKVRRGMQGAARRRTCIGKLSLGFARCAKRDDAGNVVHDADGQPLNIRCIDPETSRFRRLMFELFVEQCWSPYRIAKHFNQLKVDGWEGWSTLAVKKLLWSATAIGVFIWNKTYREFDWEQNKTVVRQTPRSEWEVFYDPSLAIVPMPLWKAARKKLSAARRKSPLTGRQPSRNQNSAKTLFSGTLFCECGRELLLDRSTRKYKSMFCKNGRDRAHGCILSTSKSTTIIEKCLLGFLMSHLLTKEAIAELVTKANSWIAEEARKPRTDTGSIKTAIRQKEVIIKHLFERIKPQEDEALIQAYERQISEQQTVLNQLKAQLRAVEVRESPLPPPLNLESVTSLLTDLRGILHQEVPIAAEMIRALTGPITIRQEPDPTQKSGARWMATFSPDLLGWLRRRAKEVNCPDSITLDHQCARNWIKPERIEVPIYSLPKYEENAKIAAEMAAKGESIAAIAAALRVPWIMARQAIEFAQTGRRPEANTPRPSE
jgi:DNA invertase Pin-like site-specific DNA recombinase